MCLYVYDFILVEKMKIRVRKKDKSGERNRLRFGKQS